MMWSSGLGKDSQIKHVKPQTNAEECAGSWKRRLRQQLASSYCQRDKKQACGPLPHVDSSTVTRSGMGGRLSNITRNTRIPSIYVPYMFSLKFLLLGLFSICRFPSSRVPGSFLK